MKDDKINKIFTQQSFLAQHPFEKENSCLRSPDILFLKTTFYSDYFLDLRDIFITTPAYFYQQKGMIFCVTDSV